MTAFEKTNDELSPERKVRKARPPEVHRKCNICQHKFKARSRFERFCPQCRVRSSAYHYADWFHSA